MKKSLVVFLAVVILLSTFTVGAGAASKVTMYSAFGKTATVWDYEVKNWEKVGWFTYPVIYVAKPGSNPILIRQDEVTKYKNRGYELPFYCSNNIIVTYDESVVTYNTLTNIAKNAYIKLRVTNLRSENVYIEPRNTKANNITVSTYCSPNKVLAGTTQVVKIKYDTVYSASRYGLKLWFNFKLWTSNGKVNERASYESDSPFYCTFY